MPPDPARQLRPRMTLRQLGVLVVFAAIASAVARPRGNSGNGADELILRVAIEVPYALILPAVFLVRRGPLKNWLLSALCCAPLLGFLLFLHVEVLPTIGPMVLIGVVDVGMIGMLIYFGRWLVPLACPNCGRWALLRDGSVPRSSRFRPPSDPRTCLACGSRFRRDRSGPRVDVDALEPAPAGAGRR